MQLIIHLPQLWKFSQYNNVFKAANVQPFIFDMFNEHLRALLYQLHIKWMKTYKICLYPANTNRTSICKMAPHFTAYALGRVFNSNQEDDIPTAILSICFYKKVIIKYLCLFFAGFNRHAIVHLSSGLLHHFDKYIFCTLYMGWSYGFESWLGCFPIIH